MAATVADTPVVTTVITTVPDAVVMPAPRRAVRPRRDTAPPGKPQGPHLPRPAKEAASDGTLPARLLAPGTRVTLIRPASVPAREFRERIGTVQEYQWYSPYQTGFPVKWADTSQWHVLSTTEVAVV